jgi:RimJ/RimL family protein N-acetyltransferase
MRRLRDHATLRHLREGDIPGRVAVLSDIQVRRNITSQTALMSEAELTRFFLDIVRGNNPSRIEFVLTGPDGDVLAYTYLEEIDYFNQTCEIGLIVLPEYRYGAGYLATLMTYQHAFAVLNMRSVLNQVFASNEMMVSVKWRESTGAVLSPRSNFTEGVIRDTYSWTEIREEFRRNNPVDSLPRPTGHAERKR